MTGDDEAGETIKMQETTSPSPALKRDCFFPG